MTWLTKDHYVVGWSSADPSWTGGAYDESWDLKTYDNAVRHARWMAESGTFSMVEVFKIGQDEPVWTWDGTTPQGR